jgi:hypothetical protein
VHERVALRVGREEKPAARPVRDGGFDLIEHCGRDRGHGAVRVDPDPRAGLLADQREVAAEVDLLRRRNHRIDGAIRDPGGDRIVAVDRPARRGEDKSRQTDGEEGSALHLTRP